MKKCKTIKDLFTSVFNGEFVVFEALEITSCFGSNDVYIHFEEGRYSYVGVEEFKLIADRLINQDGIFFKDISKYKVLFQNERRYVA